MLPAIDIGGHRHYAPSTLPDARFSSWSGAGAQSGKEQGSRALGPAGIVVSDAGDGSDAPSQRDAAPVGFPLAGVNVMHASGETVQASAVDGGIAPQRRPAPLLERGECRLTTI